MEARSTFVASRLSEGNKIFPAEIHIESTGITVKIPGLFSGESKYFDIKNIASVDYSSPMVGFSTITIYAGGTRMTAHGFTIADVKEIKEAIQARKNGLGNKNQARIKNEQNDTSQKSNNIDSEEDLPIGDALNDVINLVYINDLEDTKQKLDYISLQLTGYKWDIKNSNTVKANNRILDQCLTQFKHGIMRLKGLNPDIETVKHYEKTYSSLLRRKYLTKYWLFIAVFSIFLVSFIIYKVK